MFEIYISNLLVFLNISVICKCEYQVVYTSLQFSRFWKPAKFLSIPAKPFLAVFGPDRQLSPVSVSVTPISSGMCLQLLLCSCSHFPPPRLCCSCWCMMLMHHLSLKPILECVRGPIIYCCSLPGNQISLRKDPPSPWGKQAWRHTFDEYVCVCV